MNARNNTTVDEVFLAPLHASIDEAGERDCPKYADRDHVLAGALRALEKIDSGREWVQMAGSEFGIAGSSVSRYFGAANSERRLGLVAAVAEGVARRADRSCRPCDDPFAGHEEMRGFALYATDGHSIAASAHEPETLGKVRAPTHVYSLNLRTRSLRHVALCRPEPGRKKEHEIAALKRLDPAALRMGEPKGVKVVHAYDPAIVDYAQWARWKQGKGVYIVTVEKANSALETRRMLEWDRSDPRNAGVVADEAVAGAGGHLMRRVTYCDPATGRTYPFLTTEMTLPPGLIAFAYKLRWDIEKAYDHCKNDLGEGKAWTKGESGKLQQALFVTIAFNLCVIFERTLERDEGIRDEKSLAKARERLRLQQARAKACGRAFNALVAGLARVAKRSLQFLRWLRHCLRARSPWSEAMDDLRPLMLKYLS